MAFFLHELIQHVFSCHSLENSCSHKCHIWMAFFPHELIQHVFSCHSLDNTCSHKCHIWIVSFLHEQMWHVDSKHFFSKIYRTCQKKQISRPTVFGIQTWVLIIPIPQFARRKTIFFARLIFREFLGNIRKTAPIIKTNRVNGPDYLTSKPDDLQWRNGVIFVKFSTMNRALFSTWLCISCVLKV